MDQRGQTTVLVVGLALLCFAVAGIAVDGTRAFLLRRTLQNAADSSALAGASELDRERYYESGGRVVLLDPELAGSVASSWLARRGIGSNVLLAVDEEAIEVHIRDRLDTTFLNLIGVGTLAVEARARAEPLYPAAP
ncbi:MAG: Tad domain-containing protein [Actinomycetota bacterium]|nr:Tad domain-containing protein [Actinomycetota bacterium]